MARQDWDTTAHMHTLYTREVRKKTIRLKVQVHLPCQRRHLTISCRWVITQCNKGEQERQREREWSLKSQPAQPHQPLIFNHRPRRWKIPTLTPLPKDGHLGISYQSWGYRPLGLRFYGWGRGDKHCNADLPGCSSGDPIGTRKEGVTCSTGTAVEQLGVVKAIKDAQVLGLLMQIPQIVGKQP